LALGLAALAGAAFPASAWAAKTAPIKVKMNQITADGVGEAAGTVTIRQTKTGLELAVDLSKMAPGEHGFHMHEKGSCDPAEKDGKKAAGQAAGGHYDPGATKLHKGPGGGGHKGDLPKLTIPENGKLKTKLTVEGLTAADVEGRTLMIHAGGDNYADTPKPLGGGGDRVVCGVIPGTATATAAPAAPPVPAPVAAPAPPDKAPAGGPAMKKDPAAATPGGGKPTP
jgi:Cu-Zn family superoxide dismutase